MKACGPYLKTAILLVGVFWLWDWGHEGSETLSPGAFALADSISALLDSLLYPSAISDHSWGRIKSYRRK